VLRAAAAAADAAAAVPGNIAVAIASIDADMPVHQLGRTFPFSAHPSSETDGQLTLTPNELLFCQPPIVLVCCTHRGRPYL